MHLECIWFRYTFHGSELVICNRAPNIQTLYSLQFMAVSHKVFFVPFDGQEAALWLHIDPSGLSEVSSCQLLPPGKEWLAALEALCIGLAGALLM